MMAMLRRPTIVEALTLVGICGILVSLFIPSTATTIRWSMERRAREWQPTVAPVLADQSLLARDVDISGAWSSPHRLKRSTLAFSARPDGRYDAQFSSSGCLGGCQLSRTAALSSGTIALDGAVVEYSSGPTYDTLYALRIDDTDYLLPAPSVADFQREFSAGSDFWQFYVFKRDAAASK
jgi:hypothetical protein